MHTTTTYTLSALLAATVFVLGLYYGTARPLVVDAQTDDPVKVFIIDSGINATSFVDSEGNQLPIASTYNAIDGTTDVSDPSKYSSTADGHGTYVANVYGSELGDKIASGEVEIHVVKVADDGGNYSSESSIAALGYAMENGADVVNISYGSTVNVSQEEIDITKELTDSGAVVVAAAGNSGELLSTNGFSENPDTIVVGSLSHTDDYMTIKVNSSGVLSGDVDVYAGEGTPHILNLENTTVKGDSDIFWGATSGATPLVGSAVVSAKLDDGITNNFDTDGDGQLDAKEMQAYFDSDELTGSNDIVSSNAAVMQTAALVGGYDPNTNTFDLGGGTLVNAEDLGITARPDEILSYMQTYENMEYTPEEIGRITTIAINHSTGPMYSGEPIETPDTGTFGGYDEFGVTLDYGGTEEGQSPDVMFPGGDVSIGGLEFNVNEVFENFLVSTIAGFVVPGGGIIYNGIESTIEDVAHELTMIWAKDEEGYGGYGDGLEPSTISKVFDTLGTILSIPIDIVNYGLIQPLEKLVEAIAGGDEEAIPDIIEHSSVQPGDYNYPSGGDGNSDPNPINGSTYDDGWINFQQSQNQAATPEEGAPISGYDWIDPATGKPMVPDPSGDGTFGPNAGILDSSVQPGDYNYGMENDLMTRGTQVGNYTYLGWNPMEKEHMWQNNTAVPVSYHLGASPPAPPASGDGDSDPSDIQGDDPSDSGYDELGVTVDLDGNPIGDSDGDSDPDTTPDPYDPSQDHKDLTSGDSDSDPDTDTSSGAFGCFLAGTQVLMADGSTKGIETIAVGEYVYTYDEYADAYVSRMVTHVYEHEYEGAYLVVNDTMNITPNHITYINREWKRIDSAGIGDMLLNQFYEFVPIESIDVQYTTENVYNLEIDEVHTYMAEGYLVHNIK